MCSNNLLTKVNFKLAEGGGAQYLQFNENRLPVSEIDSILKNLCDINAVSGQELNLSFQTPKAPPSSTVYVDKLENDLDWWGITTD